MAPEEDKNLDIAIFVFVLSTTKDILDCSEANKRINYTRNPYMKHRELGVLASTF